MTRLICHAHRLKAMIFLAKVGPWDSREKARCVVCQQEIRELGLKRDAKHLAAARRGG